MSEKGDIITREDEKFLALYNETSEQAKGLLSKLRRDWLSELSGSLTFEDGTELAVNKSGTFIRIKSIFYSDQIEHGQVVHDLMTAMQSWAKQEAGCRNGISFVVHGTSLSVEFYVGVEDASHHRLSLESAFPGILFGDETSLTPFVTNMMRGGVITGVPAFSDDEQEPLYSLDRFLRGMRGKTFTLLVSGASMSEEEVNNRLNEVRRLVGDNHDRIKNNIQKQYGESVAKTIGMSVTGFGALAQLPKWGMLAGIVQPLASAVNYFGGAWSPATAALTGGVAIGSNHSTMRTRSQTYSNSLERLNRFAEAYEEALKEEEERLKRAQSEGAWRSVAFLLAKDDNTFRFAASMFKTALTERFGAHEPFRIVPLANRSDNWSGVVSSIPQTLEREEIGTVLTSSEFASLMCLPAESHPGVDIRSTRRYSVNPETLFDKPEILLGSLCDREVALTNEFGITTADLRAHTLVTGLTGMGKSTTIREVLSQADVPFLVLEPAKSEYRNLQIGGQPIRVYTAGDEAVVPFRINPFELSPGDTVHSHIDALGAIINAAFPMEGPMAALVEQGLVRAYENAGWDIASGAPPVSGAVPTMDSFYNDLAAVIDGQNLSGDYGRNIRGALLTRINSLRIGPRGRLFNSETPFDVAKLLSRPTVIEMRKVGNDESKAFLTGVLMLRIYKYFESLGESENLKNLLVLEEAHRVFKRASGKSDSLVGNNTAQHAVEIFENILSEVRAYGLGIVIADQMPLRLSEGAIKNTNLKIAHRLGAREDAVEIGGSMGLDPEHSAFLNRLKVGEALVHCSSLSEPVHVRVSKRLKSAGQEVLDAKLGAIERPNATDRRPAHFDQLRNVIENSKPGELERLADRYFTSVLVVAGAGKEERWNHIWEECLSGELPQIASSVGITLPRGEMGAHLLHGAVYALLRAKKYLVEYAPATREEVLKLWNRALSPNGITPDTGCVKELRRNLLKSQELQNRIVWPTWLDNLSEAVRGFYPEAKQTAAAILAMEDVRNAIKTAFQRDDISEAINTIVRETTTFFVPSLNLKGDTLVSFVEAVSIVILDALKVSGRSKPESLGRICNILQSQCGKEA
ncbi:MAG: ATP-binding protein [Kiritimatiellae bacterium]|nr:ATP-binding protein [Kiritimatiellia bacterium]